ncbi:MAG: hypothetical protein AB1813_09405 [Verrucomicrobiota bacterium]
MNFADGNVIRKKWLDLAKWPCVSPYVHGAGHWSHADANIRFGKLKQ